MELTHFQTDCEKRVMSALTRTGRAVINRKIAGESERYIVGNIQDHDITFWIYSDGADFQTPQEHPMFERPDFESLEELAEEFTKALVRATEK